MLTGTAACSIVFVVLRLLQHMCSRDFIYAYNSVAYDYSVNHVVSSKKKTYSILQSYSIDSRKKTNHKTKYWKRNLCALHSNIIKVLFIFEKREKKKNMFKWSPVKMLADKQTDVVYALSSCWFYFLLKRHAAHIYTRTLVFFFYLSLSFSQNLVSTCWFKQLDFPD
jgi:hypothetical protein